MIRHAALLIVLARKLDPNLTPEMMVDHLKLDVDVALEAKRLAQACEDDPEHLEPANKPQTLREIRLSVKSTIERISRSTPT